MTFLDILAMNSIFYFAAPVKETSIYCRADAFARVTRLELHLAINDYGDLTAATFHDAMQFSMRLPPDVILPLTPRGHVIPNFVSWPPTSNRT